MSSELTDSGLERRLQSLWQATSLPRSSDGGEDEQILIGSYVVEEVLGYGAFGIVYRAIDPNTGTEVALKIPRPEVLLSDERLRRFEAEATASVRLQHPWILPVLCAELKGPIPFIASKFCPGIDLARWLERNRKDSVSPEAAVRFCLKIASAVAFAHSMGVIHRDIKPSNIMLESVNEEANEVADLEQLTPKLTDFGLAKILDTPHNDSRSSWLIGTPLYMAPEQLLPDWGAVTAKTDIFAIGTLLFELVEGAPHRIGKSYTEILGGLLAGSGVECCFERSDVSNELRAIIERCLAIDPTERYGTVKELIDDLDAYLAARRVRSTRGLRWRTLKQWAKHPDRPREVCCFVVPFNLAMAFWLLLGSPYLSSTREAATDKVAVLAQGIILGVGYHLLIVFLCALRFRGIRWGLQFALPLTALITIVVPVLTIARVLPVFSEVYDEAPIFRFVVFSQILIAGVIQLALLLVAVYADQVAKQRQPDTNKP